MDDGDDNKDLQGDQYDSDPGESTKGSGRDRSRLRGRATRMKTTRTRMMRGACTMDMAHTTRGR